MKLTLLFKILIITVFCIIVIFIVTINILSPKPISKYEMEREFLKHRDIILRITKYLEGQNYSHISIWSTHKRDEMCVQIKEKRLNETIQILDETIVNDITDLFDKYNYQIIKKVGNAIYFQKWSNLKYGRGIVYTVNGDKPESELLTRLELLSGDNWYFYEEE